MAKRADPQAFVVRVTQRIAEVRRELGLTQTDVADRLGTNLRNYQRIEAGQNLTLYTVARIAAVLGKEPEDLIFSSTESRKPRTRA